MERVREALEDLKPASPKILPFGPPGQNGNHVSKNQKAV